MAYRTVTAVILAAIGGGTIGAVEINQTLYGEALVEGIFPDNYIHDGQLPDKTSTGGDFFRDSTSDFWLRAKLGAKIKIEDRVETNISLVFDAAYPERIRFSGDDSEEIALNDANVLLRRLLFEDLHLRAGRQAISWNLRRGHGAMLHDSRANNPNVTSWDGVRLHYNYDNFTFSPYYFNLNAARDRRLEGFTSTQGEANSNNSLTGIHVDWQPEGTGDGRLFITASISQERNPLIETKTIGASDVFADELWNYYGGFEWEINEEWTLWGEGTFQDGQLNDGREMKGFAYSAGVEWDVGGVNNAIVGLQYDFKSGDNDTSEGDYENFVAPWEGVSDTMIVEHERYGELSELFVGNLSAIKAKAEYKFDTLSPARPFHLKFVWGYYMIDKPVNGTDDQFGNEFDLSVTWQYNKFTSLGLFGAIFLPEQGYQDQATAVYNYTDKIDDDPITLMGLNVNVTF